MNLLKLDPASVVERVRASGTPVHIPSLKESLLRGMIGFTLVSVAGFAPWAFGISNYTSEIRMYVACASMFLITSGLFMHRLIIGPGSLVRFYGIFIPGFSLYSVAWVGCYHSIKYDSHGNLAGAVGLLTGQILFALVIGISFQAYHQIIKLATVLFFTNALGYFGGGLIIFSIFGYHGILLMLFWGVCYGLGFGAGLGLAFYICQERHREMLTQPAP